MYIDDAVVLVVAVAVVVAVVAVLFPLVVAAVVNLHFLAFANR
jgi:hypothetical protein